MVKLVGTWDGMSTNGSGVAKIMLALTKEYLSNAHAVSNFNNEEILKMIVTPVDGDALEFPSVEFFDLKVKADGESRLVFKTINQFLPDLSSDVLTNLVDAKVEVEITDIDA